MPITDLYIIGNHIQALGISRQAARLGLRVTLFNNYGASVTRFSNSCEKFIKFKHKAHLLTLLLDYNAKSRHILLVPTNDDYVKFLADHYDELISNYVLGISEPSIIDLCYNKRKTYRKALDIGIPIPKSYFPDTEKELIDLIPGIQFPVILKPAVMHTFHKETGKKVFVCQNPEDLIFFYQKMIRIIPSDEVIIQEFLQGGAKKLYSFGSFSVKGKVYGGFVANRIRQKPMDFGISTTFAKSVINHDVEQSSHKFLEHIQYFGLSEVEFMYDEKTGSYKLIEINPRSWKWHSISEKLNIPLFEMLVQYLDGNEIEPIINIKEDIGWIERLTDTYVVIKELISGRLSFKEYMSTLQIKKQSAVFDAGDPLPAVMYLLLSPYLLIKRN